MEETDSRQHISGDNYLTVLSLGDGSVQGLLRSFPGIGGAHDEPDWLEHWFLSRIEYFDANPAETPQAQIDPPAGLDQAIALAQGLTLRPFTLAQLLPHYFRGFRANTSPVIFPEGLVVIDGPNSSGKTSLAEAFEWLFTGQLTRRTLHGLGAPRELEDCICKQLRPKGEQTWVEAILRLGNGETLSLRRLLTCDYGPTSTSTPSSTLYVDGRELTQQEEASLLDELTLGTPPILMQHSLRVFVHSSPSERRDYFERLLRLDELTYVIERAVVGNSRLPDFRSPTGGVALLKLDSLKMASSRRSTKQAITQLEREPSGNLRERVAQTIYSVGKEEFQDLLEATHDIDEAIALLASTQRAERQQALPILTDLHPQRALDEHLIENLSRHGLMFQLEALRQAESTLLAAEKAADHISSAEMAISSAVSVLEQAGLIQDQLGPQKCPLCAYEVTSTLTAARLDAIHSWGPARARIHAAAEEVRSCQVALRGTAADLSQAKQSVLPEGPSEVEWEAALRATPPSIVDPGERLRRTRASMQPLVAAFAEAIREVMACLSTERMDDTRLAAAQHSVHILHEQGSALVDAARQYANDFAVLDAAVAALTREDPLYRLRETWLDVATDQDMLAVDISWQQAKLKAQRELEATREALILCRQRILDARRGQFSDGMTDIWHQLREDTYSAFYRLFIPEPRGRGFPVELEVKALLDDSVHQVEVDALRVFSESQVNALGLAAFLTRARLMGHRCIILDDPVQSMDEDHFKSFASVLLPYLLAQGLQVTLLTHNDTFSRDVSHAFASSDTYTTLKIRHSRRAGCQVDEGNRRGAERLKRAESFADEGKYDDAWRLVRLAIERVYVSAMIKHGPQDFDPTSWAHQAAEYMWESGARTIISENIPGVADRLHEILRMTAAGAHDEPSRGQTDILSAIRDIRRVMEDLCLGAA